MKGMAEFIVNPRRAPRAPARCRATVISPAGAFDAETEDISARGCQVVSPKLVKKRDALALVIRSAKVPEPLSVSGKVAWVSGQPPWRIGIAFDDGHVAAAERWFEKLVAGHPGLGAFRRVPEKIPVATTVYLGPPPRFLLDFTAEEAVLLRAIASGARIDELMVRLRDRWPAAQRALFSLIARQAVTLSRGQAAHPDAWKKILSDVEASLAVESLGDESSSLAAPPEPPRPAPTPVPARPIATPVPIRPAATPALARPVATPAPIRPAATAVHAPPAASPWGTPAQNPDRMLDLDDPGPSLETAAQTPRGAARAPASDGWGTPQREHTGAGTGWRKGSQERTADAQALFESALAEILAENVNGALELLRRALALAPGDAEIAGTLGTLAFKDRLRGGS